MLHTVSLCAHGVVATYLFIHIHKWHTHKYPLTESASGLPNLSSNSSLLKEFVECTRDFKGDFKGVYSVCAVTTSAFVLYIFLIISLVIWMCFA